jgi:hypothetical protein
MGPLFKDLLDNYPNDMELGGQIRVLGKMLNHRGFLSLSGKYPNDMDLGRYARIELRKNVK